MAGAHLRILEHQGGVDPRLAHRRIDMGGQIGNRGRPTRQAIQRLGKILGQAGWIQAELLDGPVQVRIRELQDLQSRVKALETAPRAQNTSVEGGSASSGLLSQLALTPYGQRFAQLLRLNTATIGLV